MTSVWKAKGKKLHTRDIEVATYDCDGQRIIVEGTLRDRRFQESHGITGERFPSGVVHHMILRLLVNCSTLVIEDVDVDLISVPRELCRETMDSLAPIKGLILTKGFTAKAKRLAGGSKGCTHLVELLTAMAPAAFQGFAAYKSQSPSGLNQELAKTMVKYLVNTCHAWREEGPFVESLKDKLDIHS